MTTSPRDRAAAVAEKVIGEHGEEWATCECGLGPHAVFTGCDCGVGCPESAYEAHLAAALADALVAEGLIGDGEVLAVPASDDDGRCWTYPIHPDNPYREATP